jgi:hypothetical protein
MLTSPAFFNLRSQKYILSHVLSSCLSSQPWCPIVCHQIIPSLKFQLLYTEYSSKRLNGSFSIVLKTKIVTVVKMCVATHKKVEKRCLKHLCFVKLPMEKKLISKQQSFFQSTIYILFNSMASLLN